MSDFVMALEMIGLLKPILSVVVAFGSIALYFGFIRKA